MACTCEDENAVLTFIEGIAYCVSTLTEQPTITREKTPIYFNNADYFEEVSWTIAFKPLEGTWVSYYSFTPDYYVNHNNYFKTGLNYYKDEYQETLNSHLLTNKSFNVFYGDKFPFIVEVPIKSDYVSKVLQNVKLNVEAKRFHNEFDYSINKDVGFDAVVIYNGTNNSGFLKLVAQKNLNDIRNYPITSTDKNTQTISYSSFNGYHTFNYFFNRVINQDGNVEQWINDKNFVDKKINSNIVNFKKSPRLDRIKGEYFLVRLINEDDSQHQIMLKNVVLTDKVE